LAGMAHSSLRASADRGGAGAPFAPWLRRPMCSDWRSVSAAVTSAGSPANAALVTTPDVVLINQPASRVCAGNRFTVGVWYQQFSGDRGPTASSYTTPAGRSSSTAVAWHHPRPGRSGTSGRHGSATTTPPTRSRTAAGSGSSTALPPGPTAAKASRFTSPLPRRTPLGGTAGEPERTRSSAARPWGF
jgi:hypothetical protein